jgi:hypothetical protein
MSTTGDLRVAAHFSAGKESLLFKLTPPSFMEHGANLQWVSAFPEECEYLYPPLTFLQPTGKKQTVIIKPNDSSPSSPRRARKPGAEVTLTFTIVEVMPHM